MTRITNAIKDAIIKNALDKSGVTAAITLAASKESAWNERARIEALGGPEKAAEYAGINRQAKIIHDSLPRHMQEYERIVNRGINFRLNLAGASLYIKLAELAEVPGGAIAITADNPLCQQFYDIKEERKAAEVRKTEMSAQVRAVLDKFGSIKKLLAAWPEAKELLPNIVPESKPQLPAIRVDDLNKLVGLPTGGEQA